MNNEIILTPEQLFFMGRQLQAKYIDYAYVAAMVDINQNYALFDSEVRAALVSSGILLEDFWGNIEVEPNVLNVLRPIFFGEVETSIDVCSIGETTGVSVYKYHFYDGIVTMVHGTHGKFVIRSTDQIEIREKVESLIGETYNAENSIVESVDKTHVTRCLAFKQMCVGNTSVVKNYIEADGILYQEKEEKLESVTRDQFITDAFNVVKGV